MKMTDREKMELIVSLLTDRNVGKLEKKGQLVNDDERFGALVFASHTFKQAYKILKA